MCVRFNVVSKIRTQISVFKNLFSVTGMSTHRSLTAVDIVTYLIENSQKE